MGKRYLVHLAAVLCVMALTVPAAHAILSVGTAAPDFTLPMLSGGQFTLSNNFKSPPKVVLLDFWATWCGPCKREIPYLKQFHDRYHSGGLVVCGVAVWDTESAVRSFVANEGIEYTICMDPEPSPIGDLYRVTGIPTTYILDKSGIIRYAEAGFAESLVPEMERIIQELLAGGVTVTSITPNSAPNNGVVNITELAGSGFKGGATVKLVRSGQADIAATDVTIVSETKITCKFGLAGKAVGKWNVVVTNTNEESGSLPEGFTITAGDQPPPTLTSITPDTGDDSGTVSITDLIGTGFQSGASVKLRKAGQQDIVAGNVVVVSSTKITCTFDLTGRMAGLWNVMVTNPDNQSATLENAFTVVAVPAPEPTITSITPSVGVNNGVASISNLAGSNFRAGATVQLTKTGQPSIEGLSVNVDSPTKITCAFDLMNKATGLWDVVVTNPDGKSARLANAFTITAAPAPAPTVTHISPNTGTNTGPVEITELTGTGFQSGATVRLTKLGQPDIPASNVGVISSTKITCTFDLTGKLVGSWTVKVTNPDAQSGELTNGFTISAAPNPAPSLTSIAPNMGTNDSQVSAELLGSNFREGATVKLTKSEQANIVATDVVVVNSNRITCAFDLVGKPAGQWNVVVTNTDNQSGSLTNGFTIKNPEVPPPTVTSITPDNGFNEDAVGVEIAGTGFQSRAVVKLTKLGEPDLVATGVQVVSTTKITCTLNLADRAIGRWNVVVLNADGQAGSLPSGFLVKGPPAPAPTITSVTPDSRVNTGVLVVENLAGTGFQEGAVVTLLRNTAEDPNPPVVPGSSSVQSLPIEGDYESIEATDVVVVSPTRITCKIDLYEATAGTWGVLVMNPDEQYGVLWDAVEVLPAPVLPPIASSISPSWGANTGLVNVSVFGANFAAGATVKLTRPGSSDIDGTDVVLDGHARIDCKFDLAGKAVGKWDVVVTNPDGQTTSLAEAFSVVEVLRVSGIIPNSGLNTGVVNISDLAGTGFQAGATVKLTKAGKMDVDATDVSVVSSTKITCKFDLADRAVGKWDVVVTNPDGRTAKLTESFTVCDAPIITITQPVSGPSCCRNCPVVRLAGTASDNDGLLRITWTNSRGGNGACAGTSTWCAESIPLLEGANQITVTAIDSSGRIGTDSVTVTYTSAQPGDAWRGLAMVSLPIIPDLTDPKQVVGFAGSAWSMYRTSAGQYISYGYDPEHYTWFEPRENAPGCGFWARFEGTGAMPIGTIPSQDREAVIRLYPGWNLVGQPFITAIDWDTAKIKVEVAGVRKALSESGDAVNAFAWGWDSTENRYYLVCDQSIMPDAVRSLAPWQAYWIRARKECSLILTK